MGDRDGRAMAWYQRWIDKAARGKVWLVLRPGSRWPAISVINRRGRVIAHSSEILSAWNKGEQVHVEMFGFDDVS